MEEAKKMKCYERLIFKQFVQVSGLCGSQFQSYLPKRFPHLCRALYGDAILVHSFAAPMWPRKINKNIWSTLFIQKLLLFTRELAYVRIKYPLILGMVILLSWLLKIKSRYLFSRRQHSYFGVTHCENSEVQIAVFSKWNMLREWKFVQRFDFCLSST